jgi:hypothetical protein
MARFSSLEKVGAALVLIGNIAVARCVGQQPQYITVRSELMDSLLAVADTATIEHGACLAGGLYTDSTGARLYIIDAVIAPQHVVASARHISYQCPRFATIASFHNHVLKEFAELPLGPWNWHAPTKAAEACELSTNDLLTAITNPMPVTVIGVDKQTFCWWFTSDLIARYSKAGDLPVAVQPDTAHLRTDWP